jgi:hypothetical protein
MKEITQTLIFESIYYILKVNDRLLELREIN